MLMHTTQVAAELARLDNTVHMDILIVMTVPAQPILIRWAQALAQHVQ